MQRIFFGAHYDNILTLRDTEKAIDCFQKIGSFLARAIVNQAIGPIVAGIQRATAKLVTEELVNDPRGGELRHQRLSVELRKAETTGTAAHIADHVDFMADQNAQEI